MPPFAAKIAIVQIAASCSGLMGIWDGPLFAFFAGNETPSGPYLFGSAVWNPRGFVFYHIYVFLKRRIICVRLFYFLLKEAKKIVLLNSEIPVFRFIASKSYPLAPIRARVRIFVSNLSREKNSLTFRNGYRYMSFKESSVYMEIIRDTKNSKRENSWKDS